MYHCTPEELDRQTGKYWFEMQMDLLCRNAEIEAEKFNRALRRK